MLHIGRKTATLLFTGEEEETKGAVEVSCAVSAIVMTFDQGQLAIEALDSAAAQQGVDLEIIVTNDKGHSQTRSAVDAWVRAHQDSTSVHLISPSRNIGPAGCLNAALEIADGDHVAILDGDDLWAPNALVNQACALDGESERTGAVAGLAQCMVDGSPQDYEFSSRATNTELSLEWLLRNGARRPTFSIMYRRAALSTVFPMPSHYFVCDFYVMLAVAARYELTPTDCMTGYQHYWSGSMVGSRKYGSQMAMDKLETLQQYVACSHPDARVAARAREAELLNTLIVSGQFNADLRARLVHHVRSRPSLRGVVALAKASTTGRGRT